MGEQPAARVKHQFHVYLWDSKGNTSYQQQECRASRFSEQEVADGLVGLIITARLLLPREAQDMRARYVYAQEDGDTQLVYDQGLPAVDQYLQQHNITVEPVEYDHLVQRVA
ncbi:hypothetical protein GF342_02260 [Candidatus Woesearchaeota archaeon]|nr:hypothetical protein [Candidatus Woesearchaeota archaeon]